MIMAGRQLSRIELCDISHNRYTYITTCHRMRVWCHTICVRVRAHPSARPPALTCEHLHLVIFFSRAS